MNCATRDTTETYARYSYNKDYKYCQEQPHFLHYGCLRRVMRCIGRSVGDTCPSCSSLRRRYRPEEVAHQPRLVGQALVQLIDAHHQVIDDAIRDHAVKFVVGMAADKLAHPLRARQQLARRAFGNEAQIVVESFPDGDKSDCQRRGCRTTISLKITAPDVKLQGHGLEVKLNQRDEAGEHALLAVDNLVQRKQQAVTILRGNGRIHRRQALRQTVCKKKTK